MINCYYFLMTFGDWSPKYGMEREHNIFHVLYLMKLYAQVSIFIKFICNWKR